jgi:hypothetical protein
VSHLHEDDGNRCGSKEESPSSLIEQTMTDATRRVTQWIIGIRGEVPLVEELATAEDVQSFVCGHVRWSDGTPGPAIELEDIDWTTVDWHFVLKMMHVAL